MAITTSILAVLTASLLAQDKVDPFYERLMAEGKEAFESGDFENAVKSFEVAFFGFLDDPPHLLECYVYLSVSYGELGHSEKSDYYLREIRRRKLDKHLDAAGLPKDLLRQCGLLGTEPSDLSPGREGRSAASRSVRLGDLVPIEETDSPPAVLESVEPVYPPFAYQSRREGVVNFLVLISETGEVREVKLAPRSTMGMGFVQAAEEAVRQWKFKPATKEGVRVKVWKKIIIAFKLKD